MITPHQPASSGFDPASVPLSEDAYAALAGDALARLRGGTAQRMELLLALTAQPQWQAQPHRDWKLIEQALAIGPRELELLCWQLAAELEAQGFTKAQIAAHPAMKLKQDTLEKKHKSARLPCGMAYSDYVEAYQAAYRAELQRQAETLGSADARETLALARRMRQSVDQLHSQLASHIENPSTGFWENQPELNFGKVLPDGSVELLPIPKAERKRLTVTALKLFNAELEAQARTLKAIDAVLTGNAGAQDSDDEQEEAPRLSLDELTSKMLALRERTDAIISGAPAPARRQASA